MTFKIVNYAKKTSQKRHGLDRIFRYTETKSVDFKWTLPKNQSFCITLLIWMFDNPGMKHRINRIHERALWLFHPGDSQLSFNELLAKDKIVSVYQKTCKHIRQKYSKINIIAHKSLYGS